MLEIQSPFLACTLELLISPTGELGQAYFHLSTHQLVMSIQMVDCTGFVCSFTVHVGGGRLKNIESQPAFITVRVRCTARDHFYAQRLKQITITTLSAAVYIQTNTQHLFIYSIHFNTYIHIPPTDGIPPDISGM